MARRKPTPDFSPSIAHQHLLKTQQPEFTYDGGDVKAWQRRLRRKVKACLGVSPKERCALNVRSLWKREHPLGSIEKIVFTCEPGADTPAYLCLPRNSKPPFACFICVQGHSTGMHNSIAVELDDNATPMASVPGDRDFAFQAMGHGLAALCIEQRGFGERRNPLETGATTCREATLHALQLGRTLLGERVFDVDRGIDYLATRDDIDMKRIGILGNSSGGTTSMFAAAVLPRLSFAMPSCYFCTFAASIMSITHCECNYLPGILRWGEMGDVMGLFAPKPVVVVAGREDEIFPIKAVRSEFKRLKMIYREAGAEGNCKLVIGKGGHRFYANQAWPEMLSRIEIQ